MTTWFTREMFVFIKKIRPHLKNVFKCSYLKKNMRTQTQVNKYVSRALFVRLTKIFWQSKVEYQK